MSLGGDIDEAAARRFPRVSGDEPWNQLADAIPGAFSPRERGWTVADLVGMTHLTVFPA